VLRRCNLTKIEKIAWFGRDHVARSSSGLKPLTLPQRARCCYLIATKGAELPGSARMRVMCALN